LDFGLKELLVMNEQEFKNKTKNLYTTTANVIGKQLLRSATSVGANYRAACRAKSIADLINKLSICRRRIRRNSVLARTS
jgi:four helix bundle protein